MRRDSRMGSRCFFHLCIRKLKNVTKYAIKEVYYKKTEGNSMSKRMTKRVLSFLSVVIMMVVLLPLSRATEVVEAETLTTIISAKAKYASITKTAQQQFEVVTTTDVKNLMLYAEGGTTLVKTWAASGNSSVSGNRRVWIVSQAINTAGDRKLVFKGGTTNTTPVTNAVTVSFKVENTGVISASAKNAVIKKGGEQVFTVKTTADAKYLVEYAEDGYKVTTWTASSSNSTVSGNVRTWTVKQNIITSGKRNLTFKAGTSTTPTSAQRAVAFTVEEVWVNSASAKFETIGKGGTQTFTVKTSSNAQNLMLYAEGGNLVKTWAASGNSTVSGDVRTWTVNLAIGTLGYRELTIKAGKTTTPSALGKIVKFAVFDKNIVSASAKNAAILKGATQTFTVVTSADVKNLMLYAEGGNLVKSWAASGNSTESANKLRTWNVSLAIGSTGNRKLVFKGGTTSTTAVTNAVTVSFKVEDINIQSVAVNNTLIVKGTGLVFTVKTTKDTTKLVEYSEDGAVVKTWTADNRNSTVSGNQRIWTLSQKINTAGNRTLTFKAGSSSIMSTLQKKVSFTVLASLPINATYFPDEAFRQIVKSQLDTTKDGKLNSDEILSVKELYANDSDIQDLKGVEFFTSLTGLYCFNNQLTTLDMSKNTALKCLACDNNQLTALDMSQNTALKYLYCRDNQLTSLNVSKNTDLLLLDCNNNPLKTLDVSKNTSLSSLSCNNNKLTALDVSKNTLLTALDCSVNLLTTLDISKNTALQYFYCVNNRLNSLDVSKNTALLGLRCGINQLTSLNVSANTALTVLECETNPISKLDVSHNTALVELDCSVLELTTLDVSHNTALQELYCNDNRLKTLDVSKNTELTDLGCQFNLLTTLDVSKNTALTWIYCFNNKLTTLDVSHNTALFWLSCYNNKLTALDLRNNKELLRSRLECDDEVVVTWWN